MDQKNKDIIKMNILQDTEVNKNKIDSNAPKTSIENDEKLNHDKLRFIGDDGEISQQNSHINESKFQLEYQPLEGDVDSIISSLISDYEKEVPIIELTNVSLSFVVSQDKIDNLKESIIRTLKGTRPPKVKFNVLKDISFKIFPGEKIGLIGYNGAGKSTLLNVICGIYPPDKGEVKVNGNISPLLSLGARFDYNYSGRKNIFLNGAVLGYNKSFIENKLDEIIEFSELGDFIDIPIKNYSSGMLAKLGFSIATAVNPDILIVDEILGVGDVNFQRKSIDKMKSLMYGKTTVILVSHSIQQIRQFCDKAIWIDEGELKEFGEVNQVCDKYIKDSQSKFNR